MGSGSVPNPNEEETKTIVADTKMGPTPWLWCQGPLRAARRIWIGRNATLSLHQ